MCASSHTHVFSQISASRIHRIYMCDDKGHPIRVISLSDLLERFVVEPSPNYFDVAPGQMM